MEPVRVQPVTRGHVRGGPTSRMRWAIASLVTVLVTVTSAGGFMLLSAGAATSALVGYVPSGSLAYLELRLDAPGDQRQNAANLLSHFPGFADQSTLNTKLDEALDQLVGQASSGRQNFTGTIKPWLGDSMAIVGTRLPSSKTDKAGLWLVSTKDPEGARDWASGTLGEASGTETYAGIPITFISSDQRTLAYGVISNVLLVGDPDSVHAAIDTKGASTFSQSASFKGAEASAPGDRLAFGYLDLAQLQDAAAAARPAAASTAPSGMPQLPAWVAVTVRAESDALSATIALPQTNLAPVANNHASILATRLPASTVVAGEIHDLGALFATITTSLRSSGTTALGQSDIDKALAGLGGLDSLIGWIGDGSLAVIRTDDQGGLGAGIVVQAPDAKTASEKLIQIKNLVSIAGADLGLKATDETYNGVTITVIDAGDIARLAGGAAAAALSPDGGLKLAIAQKDDLVIAGIGTEFVKALLDTKAGSSLADQANYRSALDRAGSSNTGQLYVDLQAVVDLASRHLPAADAARFQKDIKPYVDPFRAFVASGSAGDPNRVRFIISVR